MQWIFSASTGKKHDITEFNSDAVNLISHATQERLRGLLEKLTTIAQHRMTTYKVKEITKGVYTPVSLL